MQAGLERSSRCPSSSSAASQTSAVIQHARHPHSWLSSALASTLEPSRLNEDHLNETCQAASDRISTSPPAQRHLVHGNLMGSGMCFVFSDYQLDFDDGDVNETFRRRESGLGL